RQGKSGPHLEHAPLIAHVKILINLKAARNSGRLFRAFDCLEMLSASAAAGISPILLEHPVVAAKGLVELGAIGGSFSSAKVEVAFVSIFLAAPIEPGIQVRIGNSFFNFMG